MQRGKNEEIPRVSKETDGRVSDQVCSNLQEKERVGQPSCENRINKTHDHPQ